jgi:digeranylgeranylglycerophospholipid reductase
LEDVEHRDVVIIGAGPAGASAALELERLGVDHLLIDKEAFPRPKICAGVLTPAIADLVGEPPRKVIERRIRGYLLHSASGVEVRSGFPRRGYAVDRTVFDRWLVSRLEQGPLPGRLVGLQQKASCLEVRTDSSVVRCSLLIGADGVNSTVRRLAGVPDPRMATACQAAMPAAPPDIERLTGSWFHVFYTIPGGYGWVAPHHKRILVGIGSVIAGASGLLALKRFLRHPGVRRLTKDHLPDEVLAWRIPMSGPVREPCRGRVLLAGDAGGFVFPGTGEGIRYAILSGRAAGHAAARYLLGGGGISRLAGGYARRLAEEGLLSLGNVDFLDVLRSPKSAEGYLKRLTSLSRRASSS